MATTSAAPALPLSGRPDSNGAAGARLAELFRAHGATVLGLCRVLLRNRAEAEDAVQQTFLSAYTSLLNGNEPRHPAAWLATIARNECRARIEDGMRRPLGDAELESTLPDPVAHAAARADLQALWQAIGELPRRQRKALLLREFSGLSYEELAEALAVSAPTVESLLFRARRELRARLRPVTGSAASLAPLAAIRDALARAIGGLPDPSAGVVAGLASATPVVAKVAAGVAVVAVAGGTVAAVKSHTPAKAPATIVRPVADNVRPAARPSVDAVVATPRPDRIGARAPDPVRRTVPVVVRPVQPTVVSRHESTAAPAPVVAPTQTPAAPVEAPAAPPVEAAPVPVEPAAPAPEPAPAPMPASAPATAASDDGSSSSNSGPGSDDSGSGSNEVSGSSSSGPGSGTDDSSAPSADFSGSSDSSGSSGSGSGGSSDDASSSSGSDSGSGGGSDSGHDGSGSGGGSGSGDD